MNHLKTYQYLLFICCSLIFLFSCQAKKKAQTVKVDTKTNYNNKLSELKTPDELYGGLFKDIQLSQVFPDGKTFVDCTAKVKPSEIRAAYKKAKDTEGFDLKQFALQYFEVPPSISSDFKSDPNKSAAEHANALWPVLSRQADKAKEGSTLIPMPKPYIVPGGRFREVYYWDSYFTMLGLAESNRYDIIENMLDNFAYLIETVGHIPNGNRTYYKTRSQPPFFSAMVEILAAKKGKGIYTKYKQSLLDEYAFWMKQNGDDFKAYKHLVKTDVGIVNRYWDAGNTPRQESYREDFELAQKHNGGAKMYSDLRSGAESGWDYSSRWFADGQNLHSIQTTDIVPVDLNALLYGLETVLLKVVDDKSERKKIEQSQAVRQEFLLKNCYNESKGTFEDYNWVKKEKTGELSLAMVYPLFFKMVNQKEADAIAQTIEKSFLRPGGVVSTLKNTGQQWDAPNGWAPLQWMTIMGLDYYGHKELAKDIAQRWVNLNEKVYKNTGKFVEKYNVEDLSLEAGGGEYPVQDGFGWSNGVYLALQAYLAESR